MSLRKFSVVSGFSNMPYGKKRKPGNAGNQEKAFLMKIHRLSTVTTTRKLLKSRQFVI